MISKISPNEKMQALIEVRMAIDKAMIVFPVDIMRCDPTAADVLSAKYHAIQAIREYAASNEFRELEAGDEE